MNLIFTPFQLYRLKQAEKSSSNWEKNPVHQTWYFKLENCKNQVEIDRRSRCFGTTLALKIIFTTVSICFIRSVVSQENRKNWKRYRSQAKCWPNLLCWLVDKSKTDKAITTPIKQYILMSRKSRFSYFFRFTFSDTYVWIIRPIFGVAVF